MIKLVKTLLVSAAIICSSGSLAFENRHSIESLQKCNQENLPTSAQLKDLSEKDQNVALILKDERYCIKSFEGLNSLYSEVSMTSDQLYDLRKRYNSELQKFDSLEDKAIFADSFLQEASRRFVITIPMQLNKNSLSVTFVRKSYAIGSATGEPFSLLRGIDFTGEIVNLYNSHIALRKPASQEILDSVKYVISGKKKATIIRKKSLLISSNLFDGEDDEPIGDNDNDELPTTVPPYCQPGDFQCLDERDDRDHESYAERQASTWEELGWTSNWAYDEDNNEKYLVFNNAGTNQQTTGYHYNPRSERYRDTP